MSFRHYIMATAGHVDHGKSALVTALSGTDPDRLPEEKARGITIDLGFAHLELRSQHPGEPSFLVGIVDVPGHEDFVKNMVAGVGSIDLALLVVAANDGWMPQTEEHLQILAYLGVNRAVVALSKIDLTRDEAAAVSEIREKLQGTVFADAPIVPTSMVDRRGLEDLKASLASVLSRTPPPVDLGKPRLPVDRVFTLHGIGTVVTGTLTGGTLHRGENIVVQPSGRKLRVRSIQSHNQDLEMSGPGRRTALNLPDAEPAQIQRGDTVTLESCGQPSRTIDVLMEISPRASRKLRSGSRIRVHHGSGNIAGRITLGENETLAPGEHAVARFQLEAASFLYAGDRFIVRDWAEQITLAGGIVLDPDPGPHSFRSTSRLAFLRARARTRDVFHFTASQVALQGAAPCSRLLLKSRFSSADISNAIARLATEGKVAVIGDCVFDSARWRMLSDRASESVDAFHRNHPEQSGLPLCELWNTLRPELSDSQLFDAFLVGFCARDFVRLGAAVRRAAHRPELSPQLRAAGQKLRSALAACAFDPPSRKELAPDLLSQQALRFLIETGEAVEISREVVMTSENVKRATELIRRFILEHGPATVSELRQSLGSSRRVVVPLLERLDREGITLRKDDRRALCR